MNQCKYKINENDFFIYLSIISKFAEIIDKMKFEKFLEKENKNKMKLVMKSERHEKIK